MNKGSLLLVDDDRMVLESMADWLREKGYALDTANSFAAAQAAIAKKAYDLALVDIRLGDGDGFDLLGVIREKSAGTTVIFITGYGTVETAMEAIRAGAFDLLTKPLIDEELEMAIERWPSVGLPKRTKRSRPNSICVSDSRTSSVTTTGCSRSMIWSMRSPTPRQPC